MSCLIIDWLHLGEGGREGRREGVASIVSVQSLTIFELPLYSLLAAISVFFLDIIILFHYFMKFPRQGCILRQIICNYIR